MAPTIQKMPDWRAMPVELYTSHGWHELDAIAIEERGETGFEITVRYEAALPTDARDYDGAQVRLAHQVVLEEVLGEYVDGRILVLSVQL